MWNFIRRGRLLGAMFIGLSALSLIALDYLTAGVWLMLGITMLVYQPRTSEQRWEAPQRWTNRNIVAAVAFLAALVLFFVLVAMELGL